MKYYTGRIEEVLLEAYKNATLRISLSAEAHPRFGQYLLSNRPDHSSEIFPLTFFPAYAPNPDRSKEQLLLTGPVPEDWEPGMQLALRGPIGTSLALPKSALRIALYSMQASPSRLLALLNEKLPHDSSIVLISEKLPMSLPDEIEIRPPKQFKEIVNWSDFLILDIPLSKFEASLDLLESWEMNPRTKGIALISASYPCGSLADCGLCSFRVKAKEKLACKHGPIFPLSDFLS